MASSSQITADSSPSSVPCWKYDVFLSFRGPDTRKGITTNLYDRLQRRGIKTFMDDRDLDVGDVISPTLLAVIRESRFAIVVLSQNYASSTWCLEELREICLCMEDNSRILPLFYEVDPTDVRYQKRSFEDAFIKHVNSGRHNPEKVDEWKDALNKVANISGWNTNDHKTHAELVDLIVESVCRKVIPAAIEPMGELEEFQATRKAMDEVMKALKDDEINVMGVYGMGGVGKTTMVNHVGAQACRSGIFHHVVMAVVSQSPDFEKLQYALAEQLGFRFEEKSTEIGRITRLNKEIMRQEQLLIILDDVWGRIELSKIGIPSHNNLQKCKSKVLLTTRRLNVCHTMESQANIQLSILSEEDAWNLFQKKARRPIQRSSEFYEVARKIARECAGLPVALIAVARALGDKDFEDWKEAARLLEMSQPANLDEEKDVLNCIKLSYDYLESNDAKSCFLLCCLFPEDCDIQIEDLMKYGFGIGLFRDENSTIENARVVANSVIKYLKACCLLLDGTREGCVRMHDVIRDMAISIAQSVDGHSSLVKTRCDLRDWSMEVHEGYSAISLIESNIWKLPNKSVCPKLQILLLQINVNLREIPKTFFQSPNDLRVLDLRKNQDISSLPPSFSLLTRLQVLRLDCCCKITDFSILGKLKNLEILTITCCYGMENFPKEIGNLSKLKMLDLTRSNCETFPSQVISRLSRLEELYMVYSFGKWGYNIKGGFLRKNAGFDELTGLSRLNSLEVSLSGVECLPQTVTFNPNWINFYICIIRSSIKRFPNRPLKALTIEITMNDLPKWFISVVTEKTEALWYHQSYGLTNLLEEHKHGRLHGLKYLFINSSNVEVLLNSIIWSRVSNEPVFENLEEWRIKYGDYLEELCVGELPQGSLRNLKILTVDCCDRFVKPLLPLRLLHILHNLENLNCFQMFKMEYVFGFEGHEAQHLVLKRLRMISLSQMHSMRSICHGPAPAGIFQSLKILYLIDCWNLGYLFTADVARCLLQLEDVWVQNCRTLDRVIEASEETESNKIVLPQLKNLGLSYLPKLTSFSSTSSSVIDIEIECPSLEHLYVIECPQFSISASDLSSSNYVQMNDIQHWNTLLQSIINESNLSHFPQEG